MPLTFVTLFLAIPASAESVTSPAQDVLMNEIERSVRLPEGAQPLENYGRNYALDGMGWVTATYLIPSPPGNFRSGCIVSSRNNPSRPCTETEIQESERSDARRRQAQTPAGTRRWYGGVQHLPFKFEGGCTQVNIRYNIARRQFSEVSCNSLA